MAKANSTLLPEPVAARRGLLLGAIMALAAPRASRALPSHVDRVDAAAAELADALGNMHGGHWSVTVDHQHRFVLIVEALKGGAA